MKVEREQKGVENMRGEGLKGREREGNGESERKNNTQREGNLKRYTKNMAGCPSLLRFQIIFNHKLSTISYPSHVIIQSYPINILVMSILSKEKQKGEKYV